MHLITEIIWKLVTLAVVTLFCIALPFILLALVIFHPHLSPQAEDAMYFFKLYAFLFGGCAAAFWWIVIKMIIYMVSNERIRIGAWSTVLVFFGTYYVEYLVMTHGVLR